MMFSYNMILHTQNKIIVFSESAMMNCNHSGFYMLLFWILETYDIVRYINNKSVRKQIMGLF